MLFYSSLLDRMIRALTMERVDNVERVMKSKNVVFDFIDAVFWITCLTFLIVWVIK